MRIMCTVLQNNCEFFREDLRLVKYDTRETWTIQQSSMKV